MIAEVGLEVWIALLVVQGLLVAAAPVLLKIVAERAVGHAFDRRLESHKAQLTALNDTVRFDLQRQMTDVGHFAAKRHQVCAEIYHALRAAHGEVSAIDGLRREFTYEEFDEVDIERVLTERKVAHGKRDEILALFGSDRERGVRQMKDYFRVLDINAARRSHQNANNLVLLNEIYLSDELVDACQRVTRLVHGVLFDAEHPPRPGTPHGEKEREDPHPALMEVRAIMRRELGRGYSGEVRSLSADSEPGTP